MNNFTWQYSNLITGKADMESVADIEQTYDSLTNKRIADISLWKKIAVNGLHFTYEDKEHEQHTLQNIDMQLIPGKKIALVGESGSGKSTLLSLLR